MGCFVGCFGLSHSRKRRKPAIGALLPAQRHVSYKSLDSIYPDVAEDPISSDSELRVKPKQSSILKIRKKVTFNLNVEAYEPLQPDYHLLKNDEEDEDNEVSQEDVKGRLLDSSDSNSSKSESYLFPSNHRYQNCIDDEIEDDETDLEDYDYDDEEEEEDYVDAVDDLPEELPGQSCTATNNPLPLGLNRSNVRDRSNYVRPVLNPVQNLSQWKQVKARAPSTKYSTKENENAGLNQEPASNFSPFGFSLEAKQNQCRPEMQELAVDASLSNWISTTRNSCSEHVIQERTMEGSNRLI